MPKQLSALTITLTVFIFLWVVVFDTHAQGNQQQSQAFQMKDFSKSPSQKPSTSVNDIMKCIYDKCPENLKKNTTSSQNPNLPQQKTNPQAQTTPENKSVTIQNTPTKTDVIKTKTDPKKMNSIFVSKPRSEEEKANSQNQPKMVSPEEMRDILTGKKPVPQSSNQQQPQQQKQTEKIAPNLVIQDMGGNPAQQNQNRQMTQTQNQNQNKTIQQNCVKDPKKPFASCDLGEKK